MLCQLCGYLVPPERIDENRDLAGCLNCGQTFRVSENAMGPGGISRAADPGGLAPMPLLAPDGVEISQLNDRFTIRATLRSKHAILFVLAGFGALYGGSVIPGVVFATTVGSISVEITNGFIFVFVGVLFLLHAVYFWFGTVTIEGENGDGQVFVGLGPLGIRRRFHWRDVSSVSEELSYFRVNRQRLWMLVLEGKKRISFGRLLRPPHRYFILFKLRDIIDGGRFQTGGDRESTDRPQSVVSRA